MTEPVSPAEDNPSPLLPGICINWHRVRIYFWSIMIMLAMWIGATLITIRYHPERFIEEILVDLPFSHSYGKVFWVNRRTLEIDNPKLGAFFYADSIIVTASPWGLWRHHIAKIRVNGGQVFNKPLYEEMDKFSGGSPEGLDWTIGRLEISRGTIMLQNYGPDIPAIPVRLGVRNPVVMNNLKLNKPDDSPEMTKERTIEIVNVNIVSPFDPVAPVLAFPLTRVRFTYKEMWHHYVREVEMVRPTMFLGEDLFWFSDQFKKQRAAQPEVGVTAPWEIAHFEVQYGQLAVNAFGQPVVHFPFFFETEVDNIRLDQLDKISAKSNIVIKRLDQDYPDYKIRLSDLEGRLYFSLPPTDEKANNVVNTISIAEVSWNDIPVKNVSSTVTFDPNGVYGKLNGTCEAGQLTGNFEFYYTKGFTWNANFFADKINCQPIAEKLGGKYLNLTGDLNGKLSVQGKVTEILNCQGLLTLPNPGLLEIKSLDNLVKDTGGKISLKDQAMNIAINTVRVYPYDNGMLKINYQPGGGSGSLKLESAHGSRQFDMYWHPMEASSKVANDTNNQ